MPTFCLMWVNGGGCVHECCCVFAIVCVYVSSVLTALINAVQMSPLGAV